MNVKKMTLEKKVQSKGYEISLRLKAFFKERSIFTVNLIGSPGGGKTTLLEALAPRLKGRAAVIEGDLQTDEDRLRIERAGLPAYQINTQGACHLDAGMIERALDEFPLSQIQFLFIENVGNLVCPAGFEIGEAMKIAVLSVTEGDDKPAKYPNAFHVSSAMVITKTDLLPYLHCDVGRMERDALQANPALKIFRLSAQAGEGVNALIDWLEEAAASQ